ncbi:MAG: hypothetical protein AAF982_06230 [Pseudomonadota bacterium]
MQVTTVGLDLAKAIFHVHFAANRRSPAERLFPSKNSRRSLDLGAPVN